MRGKSRRWTKEQFVDAVAQSTNCVGVVKCLGLGVAGGNAGTVKRWISEWKLDTSHWNTAQQLSGLRKQHRQQTLSVDLVFIENSTASRRTVKRLLNSNKLLPIVCVMCGNEGTHNGKPLVLQLDHINGVANDNRLENLRMICPNCHTQTPTFAGRSSQK